MHLKTKYDIKMKTQASLSNGFVMESDAFVFSDYKKVECGFQNDIIWNNDSYISGKPLKYAIGTGCITKNPLPKDRVIKFKGHCRKGYCCQMALTKLPVIWTGDSWNCLVGNSIIFGKEDYGEKFYSASYITGATERICLKTEVYDFDYEVIIDPAASRFTLKIEDETYEYMDVNRNLFDGDDVYLVCYRPSLSYGTAEERIDLSNIEIMDYMLYLKGNEVWGMQEGAFRRLSDNYRGLSDDDKEQLFLTTNCEYAKSENLKALERFTFLNYAKQERNSLGILAVPREQFVMPRNMFPLNNFAGIEKAALITRTASSSLLNLRFSENGVHDLSENTWLNSGVTFAEAGRFGGKAAKINTTAYLEASDSPKWNFAQNDFTISFWLKPSDLTKGVILTQRSDGNHFCPVQVGVYDEGFYLQISSTLNVWDVLENIPYNLSVGKWYHVALVNYNHTFTVYVDGKNIYNCTTAKNFVESGDPMRLGNSGAGNLRGANCCVDDVCIIKRALWTADFSIPADYLLHNIPCCKIFVTTNLSEYYTYDFDLKDWQLVNPADLSELWQKGMHASQLGVMDRLEWDKLTKSRAGISFAYLLSSEDITDVYEVDKMEIEINRKGIWNKA